MTVLSPVRETLPKEKVRNLLLREFRDNAVEGTIIDVQLDLFDPLRLAINYAASTEMTESFTRVRERIGTFTNSSNRLKKTWFVHAWNKQLRAVAKSKDALRTELAVKPQPQDDILPKLGFCPFNGTNYAQKTRARGTRTLLMNGAVFETCVSTGFTNAVLNEGFNVVLMPDLTAGEYGRTGAELESKFETVESARGTNAWFGMLNSAEVLSVMNEARGMTPA